MSSTEVLFALLRKSHTVLKGNCPCDKQRKLILEMKYQYSKLQPTLRNLMRFMATEVERFSILNENNISKVLLNNHPSGNRRPEINLTSHPRMVDEISGTVFIICRDDIIANDIMAFQGIEHQAFIVAYSALVKAKNCQDEIIKKRDAEIKRLNVLSDYQ